LRRVDRDRYIPVAFIENREDLQVRNRIRLPMVLASVALVPAQEAAASAFAGVRMFPVTLSIDDPGVSDEASVPTFSFLPTDGENGRTNEYGFDFEWDKRITEDFGVGVNWGWNIQQAVRGKTAGGFTNLELAAKYKTYVNEEHEFLLTLGVVREIGGTGNISKGADRFGSTEPKLYFGKGLGDLPIGLFRPLAVTGVFGYQIADVKINSADNNLGNADMVNAGISVQYNMGYLQSQVRDLGFPEFVNRLIPIVELSWNVPIRSPVSDPTRFTVAPGILYVTDSWQVGVEALIPGNTATGSHIGFIAQIHLFFDDIFPNSIGKPIAEW
jgi:hypothetical protein